MRSTRSGFTLIEFMVAMALVAVLTSMGAASYMGTQKRNRDTKRKADLETLRQALELYRSDTGGYVQNLSGLVAQYMSSLPTDPRGRAYAYVPAGCSGSACSTYILCAALEDTGGNLPECGGCGGTACNYKTTNP